MDCSLQGSSVHGILQARLLEWVAISFSIMDSAKKNLDDQMDYVERVYIPERHDRGKELEGPWFPQEIWNVHTSATEQQPQDEQCSGRLA